MVTINKKEEEKSYIVTYRSKEHFEVAGWVWAENMIEARKKAKKELTEEVRKYDIGIAEIAEYNNPAEIFFD